MRRAILLLAAFGALCAAAEADAHPRVRAGTIRLLGPSAHDVQVVVALDLPPLALRGDRGLATAVARRKLNVAAASSRAYLRRVDAEQARAVTALHRAIPEAHVGRRFRIVLDGLTVGLPASRLPLLLRQPWAAHVYPSVQYALATDRSPSIIGADVLHQTTGADGAGIKIAVVDDGIDQTNPFFLPTAFGPVPAGFPKGISSATTAKVIVARVFPGPGAGAAGRLPVDPESSFHGTHVAGITAGVAGTTAPAGADHPRTTGLSGVAPRAWLGNYRVFTVPTPIGHVANTPEIVAAFEAAVSDGMDVINFSGGGPQVDPANDALVAAVHAVAAAGVVPVIAAGNDRDDFGVGSVGSPGTAPDAISVAAVSNTHVFAPALDVTAAGGPKGIPFMGANGERAPVAWGDTDQTLVDVGTLAERHLCKPLAKGSLAGAIVLVQRGLCPFNDKADRARAAGAKGIVFFDNREGEANGVPAQLSIPGGMIANLDGRRLIDFVAAHGGRTTIRVGRAPLELDTGRSGVITSFSSAGPTAFGHLLKPDVSAPGGQILSSTLPQTDASRFAVFDGTSMATPHVAGAAALLLQLHRSWTPGQVKSALASTAGAAWGDTARTQEASVPLEGAGLVSAPRANDPQLFTAPTSLSFADLAPGATKTIFVHVTDAGDGAGTWTAAPSAQATTGGTVDTGGLLALPPGGSVDLSVTARAADDAANGENYGFVLLRRGGVTRRVPYFFLVDRPTLAAAPAQPLRRSQRGTTAGGPDRVQRYRYPAAPFGNVPDSPVMLESGSEVVYSTTLPAKAVNAGVSVIDKRTGARIDPWYLGSKDENSVQGFAGTPVDVNELTYDYLGVVGAAGVAFPSAGTYYVAVDSPPQQAGRYLLRSWVNDLKPPTLQLLTTRVSAGHPTIVFRSLDTQSGVDPASLTLGFVGTLLAVGNYDPASGLAVFPLPASVPRLPAGSTSLRMISSDFQEAKNVDTSGRAIMPNTRTASATLHVVRGLAIDWLLPGTACTSRRADLEVAAGGPRRLARVVFTVDGRRVAIDRAANHGIWSATVPLKRGSHALVATVIDVRGAASSARRIVRTCNA